MPAVEVIIKDPTKNMTHRLYGQVVDPLTINTSLSEVRGIQATYDSKGAMAYMFAVIFVYSISIFLLIAMLSRRKTSSMKLETEVSTYMKGLEYVNKQCKMDRVLYARFKIPGNFVGMRSDTRIARYMNRKSGVKSLLQNCVDQNQTVSIPDFPIRNYDMISNSDENLDYYTACRGHIRCQEKMMSVKTSDESDEDIQLLPAITRQQQENTVEQEEQVEEKDGKTERDRYEDDNEDDDDYDDEMVEMIKKSDHPIEIRGSNIFIICDNGKNLENKKVAQPI